MEGMEWRGDESLRKAVGLVMSKAGLFHMKAMGVDMQWNIFVAGKEEEDGRKPGGGRKKGKEKAEESTFLYALASAAAHYLTLFTSSQRWRWCAKILRERLWINRSMAKCAASKNFSNRHVINGGTSAEMLWRKKLNQQSISVEKENYKTNWPASYSVDVVGCGDNLQISLFSISVTSAVAVSVSW